MRTTLDIDDPILREVKAFHEKEGRSMGAVVSELLADALARRRTSRGRPAFRWTSRPMKARIDIADKAALIFSAPLTPDEALANVNALLALPQARVVSERDGFMDAYLHVTAGTTMRGNLVPDAHIAAILFQNGVRTLYSNDRDFRKFESLDVRDPFA